MEHSGLITVTCRIGVGFILRAHFLRTVFAGVLLHALYPAHTDFPLHRLPH